MTWVGAGVSMNVCLSPNVYRDAYSMQKQTEAEAERNFH